MSPKVLIATHAVDVGGQIVEPGGEIPKDADEEVVKQLEDDGLIEDTGKSKSSSKEE